MASTTASTRGRDRHATPPPPSEPIRTPPTPRYGAYEDRWEPYSPRKSARIAQKTAATVARTPSPPPASARFAASSAAKSSVLHSAHKSKITKSPVSPKKKVPATPRRKAAMSKLSLDPTSLNVVAGSSAKKDGPSSTYLDVAGMMTPAKTPRKTPAKEKELDSISRNLFTTEPATPDATPARRRKVKKYTGTSLDTFNEEVEEEAINIFTDARERPFVVESKTDDPFTRTSKAPVRAQPESSTRRRSKRKVVSVPGEGRVTMDEAVKREDGIVYNFRGKRFLRKFSEEPVGDSDVMRSSSGLKPRLLFPPKKTEAPASSLEDEEADTDVDEETKNEVIVHEEEEEEIVAVSVAIPATPKQVPASLPTKSQTPKAPIAAPMTPPSTKRTLRQSDKYEVEPLKRSHAVFEQWRNPGTKRRASDDDDEEEVIRKPAKRARA